MGIRAVVAVTGALAAVGGLFIVISVAASQPQQDGISFVVIACFLILCGAVSVASALRPQTLTVDDGGLHLRTLTRVRVIPWSLVRSFRTLSPMVGIWWVQAELGTGKKVRLGGCQGSYGRASRIAAELTAAYREHLAQRPSL